jgi:hypothetical protein
MKHNYCLNESVQFGCTDRFHMFRVPFKIAVVLASGYRLNVSVECSILENTAYSCIQPIKLRCNMYKKQPV